MNVDSRKLKALFQFLKKHREWNDQFQSEHYRRNLLYCATPLEKLTSLLHSTVNTQSQPKLDQLGQFWKNFSEFSPPGRPSLEMLCGYLEGRSVVPAAANEGPWHRLYLALKGSKGWGDKTAALFVKNAINVHRGPKHLHFLSDAAARKQIKAPDKVYLPVDAVIIHIFARLGNCTATFKSVNDLLWQHSPNPEDVLVWDDLWYWGFFSQASVLNGDGGGAKRTRRLQWNEEKFWCQLATPKDKIATVRKLATQFISLCEPDPAS